jgi:FtsZ-binding cell division protein ZapB
MKDDSWRGTYSELKKENAALKFQVADCFHAAKDLNEVVADLQQENADWQKRLAVARDLVLGAQERLDEQTAAGRKRLPKSVVFISAIAYFLLGGAVAFGAFSAIYPTSIIIPGNCGHHEVQPEHTR